MKIRHLILALATVLIASISFAADPSSPDVLSFSSGAETCAAGTAAQDTAAGNSLDGLLLVAPIPGYYKDDAEFCDSTGDCTSKSCKTDAVIACPAGYSKRNVNCSVKTNRICAAGCKCFCSWECHKRDTAPADPEETEEPAASDA